jgi:hypothetical protein
LVSFGSRKVAVIFTKAILHENQKDDEFNFSQSRKKLVWVGGGESGERKRGRGKRG